MARVDCLDMAVFGAKYAGTLLERVAALENEEPRIENLKMQQPRCR
jgi:hypothetical protein